MLTPIMRQYREQKAFVPDAMLLFRVGDFYETFFDDATQASKVLGITLVTRQQAGGKCCPMAGFPCHSADAYIAQLVRSGIKVAVSDYAAA